ncbi:MAG: transposase [Segetibacter sp.]
MFTLLFDAASYTLLKFAKDEKYLGCTTRYYSSASHVGSAVKLSSACSLHCKRRWYSPRPLQREGRTEWKEAVKAKHKFLFPTKAVQPVYRAYFLKQLQQQIDKGIITMTEEQHKDWLELRTALYNMDWIVEFREPMGGPAQVLEYLGQVYSQSGYQQSPYKAH